MKGKEFLDDASKREAGGGKPKQSPARKKHPRKPEPDKTASRDTAKDEHKEES
jgi:hypothetical protein